jgi:hypothetical protein
VTDTELSFTSSASILFISTSAILIMSGTKTWTARSAMPTTTLKKQRLEEEIHRFHDTIDDFEIERHFDGRPIAEPLVPRAIQFESPERALVAKFIPLSLNASKDSEALGGKVALTEALVGLRRQQEHQRRPGKYDRQVVRVDLERASLPDCSWTASLADRQLRSSISNGVQDWQTGNFGAAFPTECRKRQKGTRALLATA